MFQAGWAQTRSLQPLGLDMYLIFEIGPCLDMTLPARPGRWARLLKAYSSPNSKAYCLLLDHDFNIVRKFLPKKKKNIVRKWFFCSILEFLSWPEHIYFSRRLALCHFSLRRYDRNLAFLISNNVIKNKRRKYIMETKNYKNLKELKNL